MSVILSKAKSAINHPVALLLAGIVAGAAALHFDSASSSPDRHSTFAQLPEQCQAARVSDAPFEQSPRSFPEGLSPERAAPNPTSPPNQGSGRANAAIRDGNWSDADTWSAGVIPGTGDRVLIPSGIAVRYDAASAARIASIRVEGSLSWATDTDTVLWVETLTSTADGILEIGTDANPVTADAEIVFHSTTPGILPVVSAARGLQTQGKVRIVGLDKLDHTSIVGEIRAGDTHFTVRETPTGWNAGDRVVVAGTDYDPTGRDADNSRFHDEVLEITAIAGNTICFANPDTGGNSFRFEHVLPDGYESEFEIPVGNLTRNIVFRSEFGDETPVPDRGHLMFAGSDDVIVKHFQAEGLGRTNKAELLDPRSNPEGRYAVHFHRNGANVGEPAAGGEGIAVIGSPGWGIVHHDSHVRLRDNVVFGVAGSAIVAEAGNEVGRWENNLTVKTVGDGNLMPEFDGSDRVPLFDFGFNGEGYWIQGSHLIESVGNTAVSSAGAGYEIFSDVDGNNNKDNSGEQIYVRNLNPGQRQTYLEAGFSPDDRIDAISGMGETIADITVINSRKAIETWNHNRNDDGFGANFGGDAHASRTVVAGVKGWGIWAEGIFTQYSTQIDFKDVTLVGDPDNPITFDPGINGNTFGRGIGSNGPAHDILFENVKVDGFEVAVRVPNNGISGGQGLEYGKHNASRFANLEIDNAGTAFGNINGRGQSSQSFPNYAFLDGLTIGSGVTPSQAPVAAFSATNLGRGVVEFDASASYDPDPNAALVGTGPDNPVFYLWDFDNDGITDDFGKVVVGEFDRPGPREVKLTVVDFSGIESAVTQRIDATDAPLGDIIEDGGFDAGETSRAPWYAIGAGAAGAGWGGSGWDLSSGRAVVTEAGVNNGISQVLWNQGAHEGRQILSFDLQHSADGNLDVSLHGYNSEFEVQAGQDRVPRYYKALPVEGDVLYHGTFGQTSGTETQTIAIDFGPDGYEYLVLSFRAEPNASGGIAIDNVAVAGG